VVRMGLLDLGGGRRDLSLYYQHDKGEIRSSELRGNAWRQVPSSDIVVASNVKNGTPIAAISYIKDAALTVRESSRDDSGDGFFD